MVNVYVDLVVFTRIAGVPVYLAPWTGCPPGGKPTTVALPPGGQAVPGYLAPHPGYLHPRGASCPGRCPSLSCPLDRLPPGGQANHGCLAPRGASCPGISCPPPWLSSPPGGKLSRPVYLAPRPTQVKIYTCYFVIFLYHFNELRSSISHKVRNWCLWG